MTDRRTREELLAELASLSARFERLRRQVAEAPPAATAPEDAAGARLDNVYFRQLFENSPQAIVLLDDADRVIDCNAGFEELFGYERAEARGASINSLIVPEESAEEASALSERALEGEIINTESARCRKDGALVEVQILGYPIFQDDRQIGIFGIYSDIGSHRRAQETIRLQQAAIDSSASAVFITDRRGEIVWVNSAFRQMSGRAEEEVVGRRPDFLDGGRGEAGLDPERWEELAARGDWRGRVVCRARDGRFYTVEQRVTAVRGAAGEVSHFVVAQEDVSARLDAENRVDYLSRNDALTDLPNRYTLSERLEMEIERAVRMGRRVAVMALDLDHFKDINDAYGHPVGDELLVAVAGRLRRELPVGCTLSRTGGDEFAVVQTDFYQLYDANSLARRLLTCFDEPFSVGGRRIFISASVGVAAFPPGEADARQLLKRADLALYRAKEEGRAEYRMHTAGMDREQHHRTRLTQQLHEAVDREQLFLEYQPQVELTSGEILGVEALVRWEHPERGRLLPAEFIHLAESSGLIVPIGEWVLWRACNEARTWENEAWPHLTVSVNASALQFRHPDFGETVARSLAQSGLAAERLELELTEGVLMRPTPVADRNFQRLEALGVRFALDDFGKGYSSLAYLRRLRLHKLKIDRSFVLGLESEPSQGVIVSAVTALGQQLGLQVIAEGVETAEQEEILRAKGCTAVQGDRFCPPVSPDRLRAVLQAGGGRLSADGIA